MTTATIDHTQVQAAHIKALAAAQTAAKAFSDKHFGGSDGGACGFAWVNVYKVRSNSKLGKALQEVGFRKDYSGALQLWNKWWPGQSVDAADHGATAYAAVIKQELGIEDVYAGSRLD
jgi:hypothetical protein